MDFSGYTWSLNKTAPDRLALHFKWGHQKYSRLYERDSWRRGDGGHAPLMFLHGADSFLFFPIYNFFFFFFFNNFSTPTKKKKKKAIQDLFWFHKPFNLLLPGECTRSKREPTTSHHARNNIISVPLLENIAKITTDDYSCLRHFKQRINWCLVFAHWSWWQSGISVLEWAPGWGNQKWLSGCVSTSSFVLTTANPGRIGRHCAEHCAILCLVLSSLFFGRIIFRCSDTDRRH